MHFTKLSGYFWANLYTTNWQKVNVRNIREIAISEFMQYYIQRPRHLAEKVLTMLLLHMPKMQI